jgi:two-component system NarL family sensor kinase
VTVCLGFVCHPALCHEVQLKVIDDGTGFDVQAATQGRHSGMGLRLMRLAVETVGGRMAIRSSSAGTSVNITLPLD